MSVWDRFWFTPIAAVRPYLLTKFVLLLLAFDLCLVRIPGGSLYGLGDFNVAQFAWLDALQPQPSSALYVGITLTASILALIAVMTQANRFILGLVCLLYTYAWAMSMLDQFQHHYFISLVLFCLVFFPKQTATGGTPATDRDTGIRDKGTRDKAIKEKAIPNTSLTSAWSYRLLAVNIAIVYAYSIVAKWNSNWLSGAILQQYSQPDTIDLIIQIGGPFGLNQSNVWQRLAAGAVLLELVMAIGYLLATLQDTIRSKWLRYTISLAWLIAIMLHGGIELLGFHIGWFSYYMLGLATVYFLPARFLESFTALVLRPVRWLGQQWGRWDQATLATSKLASLALLVAVGAGLCLLGRTINLPGAWVVYVSVAAWAVGWAIRQWTQGLKPIRSASLIATGV
ncbi:MAG: HTTM domain-containing protein, partial [Planctomycetales bacterium]